MISIALSKAKFITDEGKEIIVNFNPSEYTLSNNYNNHNYKNISENNNNINMPINKNLAETLTFSLYFDTYTKEGIWGNDAALVKSQSEDVRKYTNEINNLAINSKKNKKKVQFVWGSLNFTGTIASITNKYTMFEDDGRPVRANLTISMVSDDFDSFKKLNNEGIAMIDFSKENWKENATLFAKSKIGKIRDCLQ